VRRMLNDYSYRHPATRYALLNLGEELPLRAREEGITGTICPECGEPCRGSCQTCRMLREVSVHVRH
ncbi:MAG: tRNA(Ile)-lysidine synthase, partial [Methanomicrobiales archaeon]|nr:tRNA(Ile)-lysidine synthase [Methanomicrobiales archaeon]